MAGGWDAAVPYVELSREQWSELRKNTPLTLTEDELEELRGVDDPIDLAEVTDVYLPLTRLLNLHFTGARQRNAAVNTFLGAGREPAPYILGIAGSVAVGKSTTARLLHTLLARWPEHPRVELITTDSFLYPNRVLAERDIMHRKGFPESYDRRALVRFVADVKAGLPEVTAPVYSHLEYDIVPGAVQTVRRPDILIVEGLNVLQPAPPTALAVNDYFDFSIYVDAKVEHIRDWYVDRFHKLRRTAFEDPKSYFRHLAEMSDAEATAFARDIWRDINERNLVENIAPTRGRAGLVLRKGADHSISRVRLRRV
ncbi:type I pantothenate kinase [Planomonospora sp. ID91781]|uniref:Pantothenate kinase n=3 Tax=Planomonospora TaxID=1998 RepID=A0A171CBB7_9ACTN|nr:MULTISPECIES: type I pantothenate kinase [Planomonospora]MBG0820702.1 type I pantothenate kinase [Planomonospora sp. ID91781]GAT66442.1 type I pantothenate kinase [Planomonospora sphaerica]GGK55332.1 pantothenate kinase [Planomonospora parontospora]GII07399.1 pantothenate kinase [Planomonospora parontospora subsp. parontospora]